MLASLQKACIFPGWVHTTYLRKALTMESRIMESHSHEEIGPFLGWVEVEEFTLVGLKSRDLTLVGPFSGWVKVEGPYSGRAFLRLG